MGKDDVSLFEPGYINLDVVQTMLEGVVFFSSDNRFEIEMILIEHLLARSIIFSDVFDVLPNHLVKMLREGCCRMV